MDEKQKKEEKKKSIFESKKLMRALKEEDRQFYENCMKKTPSKLQEPFTPKRKGTGAASPDGRGKKNEDFILVNNKNHFIHIWKKSKEHVITDPIKKNKKYSVFEKVGKNEYKYLLSFGDSRYEHYKDKLGKYSSSDHNDLKKKDNYYKRHGTTDDVHSALYFSNKYLW